MFDVPFTPDSPICPRCLEPVRLEDAKTDEDGRAIHEDCYYATLKGTTQSHEGGAPRSSYHAIHR
jgi:hypothetical protein